MASPNGELTLSQDRYFTIVTDAAGRSYHVLNTTGQPPAFRLSAIRGGYPDRRIGPKHPQYEAIAAMERDRRARILDAPPTGRSYDHAEFA